MIKFLGFNHISTALGSFRTNKFRTLLTIVGISVGIGLLTLVVALQAAFVDMTQRQIRGFYRENSLVVRAQDKRDSDWFNFNQKSDANLKIINFLDEKDLAQIKTVPEVAVAAPILSIEVDVQVQQRNYSQQTIIATNPDFLKTVNLKVKDDGQFLDEKIIPNAAVIGHDLVNQWYDVQQVIGHTFRTQNESFTIVGVLDKQQTIDGHGMDFSQVAIVNLASGEQLSRELNLLNQIYVTLKPDAKVESAVDKINQVLSVNHPGGHSFEVVTPDQIQARQSSQLLPLAQVVNIMAIVALAIGGVGVMNIMLVNVSERTHEIGVRRTIGATGLNIITQYLVESVLFCLIGGLIGVGLAILTWAVLQTQFDLLMLFDAKLVVRMLAIACLIGAVAGLLPSVRAANKDPIESLKRF